MGRRGAVAIMGSRSLGLAGLLGRKIFQQCGFVNPEKMIRETLETGSV